MPGKPNKSRKTAKSRKSNKRKSAKRIILPKPTPGMLSVFGYKAHYVAIERHRALAAAAKKDGYAAVIRHLNELVIFNKNKHPEISNIYKSDMAYLKNNRSKLKL